MKFGGKRIPLLAQIWTPINSQPELGEINELKERILVECIKVQNTEISESNSLLKSEIPVRTNVLFKKINIVVKNIIHEREPDLTSLNHLIYTSVVISTELCNVKIKAPKRNVSKKRAWQERIQKQIHTLRSDLETLKNVQNDNNVKISKSRKLRTKYAIKRPEEIQTVLKKIKQTVQAKAARLYDIKNVLFSTKITTYLKTIPNNSIEILVNLKSK